MILCVLYHALEVDIMLFIRTQVLWGVISLTVRGQSRGTDPATPRLPWAGAGSGCSRRGRGGKTRILNIHYDVPLYSTKTKRVLGGECNGLDYSH